MRLSSRIAFVVVCVVGAALTPSRADAWFGWLDRLSGPGPFWGAAVDVRFFCFGPEFEGAAFVARFERVLEAEARAVGNTTSKGYDAVALSEAAAEWQRLLDAYMNDPKADEIFGPLLDADRKALAETTNHRLQTADVVLLIDALRTGRTLPADARVATALRDVAERISPVGKAQIARNAIGVFVSLCPDYERKRVLSIELNAEESFAFPEPQFANDRVIHLLKLFPSFTVRLSDFADFGVGVGGYAFLSTGFNAFGGTVGEVFVHGHVPPASPRTKQTSATTNQTSATTNQTPAMTKPTWLREFLSSLDLRVGVLKFRNGFGSDAFAATGDKARPIGPEWNWTATVFYNVKPHRRLNRP